jgi:PAS domain-containing protein
LTSPNPVEVSADEARRMALAAQGFTDRRPTGRVDRRHLRRVLDRIPAPVSYVDTALRFRYNNRAYDAWVGRPHEGLSSTHVREVLGEVGG